MSVFLSSEGSVRESHISLIRRRVSVDYVEVVLLASLTQLYNDLPVMLLQSNTIIIDFHTFIFAGKGYDRRGLQRLNYSLAQPIYVYMKERSSLNTRVL